MVQEGNFSGLLIGLVLVTLFSVLILSAVVDVGTTYSLDTSEIVGGATDLDALQSNVESIEGDAQSFEKRFREGNIWSIVAGIVVEGIFGIAIDMIKIILNSFSFITAILTTILGVPAYVTGVLIGILIFTMIFAIWRLLKIGA